MLRDEMKEYIFKVNGISGFVQYIILGIFIAVGTYFITQQYYNIKYYHLGISYYW